MIPDIKKILYATDLSENAIHSFGYAASLANKYQGKITIIHVLEELPPNASERMAAILGKEKWEEILKEDEQKVIDDLRTRLEKFCEDRLNQFPQCPFIVEDIILRQGSPVDEILRESKKGDYDVVVMGCHGRGLFGGAFLGSTARRVVRHSKKPVFVVRQPE